MIVTLTFSDFKQSLLKLDRGNSEFRIRFNFSERKGYFFKGMERIKGEAMVR